MARSTDETEPSQRRRPGRPKVGSIDRLVISIADGAGVDFAARAAGMSPETAYRRLKDPAVIARVQEIKRDKLRAVSGVLVPLASEGARVLFSVMQDPNATNSEKISAATAALRFAGPFWAMSNIEDRLAALEAEDRRLRAVGELG